MDLQTACTQLQTQAQAISALASSLTDEQARWQPNAESWSVLVVICHLVDEEIEDFRAHLDHILHTPEAPWPEIDPVGWVTQRRYSDRQLRDALAQFQQEREHSIDWLHSLENPDWDSAVSHPWGTLTAGDMLASWLAHDLLHTRQLTELRYQLTQSAAQPYRVGYAGKW